MVVVVQERSANVGGRRVRFLEAGSGWPVLLLHAFPLNADLWRPQLERVPAGFRFVAPDMMARPGHETVDAMAADVLQLAAHLEIERAVIGGISMGGYVTLAAYRQEPQRFTGMLLANTRATADTPEARRGRERMIALARERGAPAIVDELLPKLLGATSMRERPDVRAAVRLIAQSNTPEALTGALAAMMARADTSDVLPGLSCSTLVVAGDEDLATPLEEVERMKGSIPRSRLVVLRGAGHLSCLEAPDQFSRALADFLRSPV